MKICNLAYMGTFNRPVKFGLKIPNRLGNNVRKPQGKGFDSHCVIGNGG